MIAVSYAEMNDTGHSISDSAWHSYEASSNQVEDMEEIRVFRSSDDQDDMECVMSFTLDGNNCTNFTPDSNSYGYASGCDSMSRQQLTSNPSINSVTSHNSSPVIPVQLISASGITEHNNTRLLSESVYLPQNCSEINTSVNSSDRIGISQTATPFPNRNTLIRRTPLKNRNSFEKQNKLTCKSRLNRSSVRKQVNSKIVYNDIGAGLQNLGNTCFLNATVQCLTYTSPFLQALLTSNEVCRVVGVCLMCEMTQHVKQCLSRPAGIYQPHSLLNKLKSIACHMRWGRQEDAHEFLRFFVDALHKSCIAGHQTVAEYDHKSIEMSISGNTVCDSIGFVKKPLRHRSIDAAFSCSNSSEMYHTSSDGCLGSGCFGGIVGGSHEAVSLSDMECKSSDIRDCNEDLCVRNINICENSSVNGCVTARVTDGSIIQSSDGSINSSCCNTQSISGCSCYSCSNNSTCSTTRCCSLSQTLCNSESSSITVEQNISSLKQSETETCNSDLTSINMNECIGETTAERRLSSDHESTERMSESSINDVFAGFLRSQVSCMECGWKSNTFDPFLDLCLDVRNSATLEMSLSRYVQPEILETDNAYYCNKCQKKVRAEKLLTLHHLPTVLNIQLKRYSVLGGKVTRHIAFPEHLNVKPYMSSHVAVLQNNDNLNEISIPAEKTLCDSVNEETSNDFSIPVINGVNSTTCETQQSNVPAEINNTTSTEDNAQKLESLSTRTDSPGDAQLNHTDQVNPICEPLGVAPSLNSVTTSTVGVFQEPPQTSTSSLSSGSTSNILEDKFIIVSSNSAEKSESLNEVKQNSVTSADKPSEPLYNGCDENGSITKLSIECSDLMLNSSEGSKEDVTLPDDSEIGKSTSYNLYAVLVHEGQSTSSGHYYCYVRTLDRLHWYCLNDSIVRRVTLDQVLSAEAYLLFYRRDESDAITLDATSCSDSSVVDHFIKLLQSSAQLTVSESSSNHSTTCNNKLYRTPVRKICRKSPVGSSLKRGLLTNHHGAQISRNRCLTRICTPEKKRLKTVVGASSATVSIGMVSRPKSKRLLEIKEKCKISPRLNDTAENVLDKFKSLNGNTHLLRTNNNNNSSKSVLTRLQTKVGLEEKGQNSAVRNLHLGQSLNVIKEPAEKYKSREESSSMLRTTSHGNSNSSAIVLPNAKLSANSNISLLNINKVPFVDLSCSRLLNINENQNRWTVSKENLSNRNVNSLESESAEIKSGLSTCESNSPLMGREVTSRACNGRARLDTEDCSRPTRSRPSNSANISMLSTDSNVALTESSEKEELVESRRKRIKFNGNVSEQSNSNHLSRLRQLYRPEQRRAAVECQEELNQVLSAPCLKIKVKKVATSQSGSEIYKIIDE